MTQYGTIITNIGLAQIANAQVTQQKVGLQYIALGDGNGSYYVPNANQTTLVNEVWRGPVSNVTIDPANDNRIIIEGLIPPTAGGFTIREIAVFDDQNQLIAVGQYPEKYKPQLSEGVSEETLIHFMIETNNVDAVELAIDPTIIIASREYVDEKVAEHKEQITAAVQDLEDLVESIVQTGVAKLVRYSYTIPATTDGQTEIEIPLATFDQDTDTVLLIRDSIVLYETVDYTISTRKIVLNTPIGIAANTSFYLLILKNVPAGEEGGVSGGVITDGSIAKRKLEQTLQDDIGNAWQKGVYNNVDVTNLGVHTATKSLIFYAQEWVTTNVGVLYIRIPAPVFWGTVEVDIASAFNTTNAAGGAKLIYHIGKLNSTVYLNKKDTVSISPLFAEQYHQDIVMFDDEGFSIRLLKAPQANNTVSIKVSINAAMVNDNDVFSVARNTHLMYEDTGSPINPNYPWTPQTSSFVEKSSTSILDKNTPLVFAPGEMRGHLFHKDGGGNFHITSTVSPTNLNGDWLKSVIFESTGNLNIATGVLRLLYADIIFGYGNPEGVVIANVGSLYLRGDAGLYFKASGTGNTGWVEK